MTCRRFFVPPVLAACLAVMAAICQAQEPAAEPEAPPTLQNETTQPRGDYSVLDLLHRGGPVMYPLYACSVLLIAFWLERAISLRTKKVIPASIMRSIKAASSAGDPAERKNFLNEIMADASPMAKIIQAGLKKSDRPPLEMEKAIEDAGAKEAAWLQRNNKVFAAVATVAPLLGLLGTVTGLMRSFMTVAASPEALGKMEMMAGGIYEALVTTVVGLTIAIPAMLLYFYYQDRVDRLVRDIDGAAEELLEKMAGIKNEDSK